MPTTRKTQTQPILSALMLLLLAVSTFIQAAPAAAQAPTTQGAQIQTAAVCDQAQFVADVTVADGTRFTPGTRFTKTWRLKNTGTCTWTRDYELVFDDGHRMGGASAIALGTSVRPGRTVDLSVVLVAPKNPGEYTGFWMLSNADGERFGLGNKHDQPFWVTIQAAKPAKLYRDLAKETCQAAWSSGAGGLACPDTSQNTTRGFINLDSKPVLENGRHENETALVTYPSAGEDGSIQGRFPSYKVKDGDHFRAVIGLLEDSQGGKVSFQLGYRTRRGQVKVLATWSEKYDHKIQKIDYDLSELAGKEIELVLTVLSKDDNTNDRAFWLRPSIWR